MRCSFRIKERKHPLLSLMYFTLPSGPCGSPRHVRKLAHRARARVFFGGDWAEKVTKALGQTSLIQIQRSNLPKQFGVIEALQQTQPCRGSSEKLDGQRRAIEEPLNRCLLSRSFEFTRAKSRSTRSVGEYIAQPGQPAITRSEASSNISRWFPIDLQGLHELLY